MMPAWWCCRLCDHTLAVSIVCLPRVVRLPDQSPTEILRAEPLTEGRSEPTFADMRRWNITWPSLLVLVVAVGVIVFLLIHPDVDPPDTAFHLGTAPVVVHARTNARAAFMAVSVRAKFSPSPEYPVIRNDLSRTIQSPHDSILLLDRSLRI
jgi:hypothetical protein